MSLRPKPSALFDWSMAVASLWCSGGILLDAWYHFHTTVETFFEPAHALLYAGLLASFVFTGITLAHNHRRGFAWRDALPQGYETTIAGLFVFLAGGVLDVIKHTFWGFEQGFDALLSPTHLVIGAGMFLIISGPVRSALERERPPTTLGAQLPMLLALASMMELVHWGTQFIFLSEAERMNAPLNPALFPHDTLTLLSLLYDKQGIGLLAVIVQSLLLMGFALFAARNIRLAPGALVVLFVAGNLFVAAAHSNHAGQFIAVLLASACAGALGDALRLDFTRTDARWHIFAFGALALYWSILLLVLALTMGGIWWTPDVISGSIVIAGLTGSFLYAMLGTRPPTGGTDQHPLERSLRAVILAAAQNGTVQRAVSRYGMQLGARRFVAGETDDDFLRVAREVNSRGFAVACGILGEGVRERGEATAAADRYCALLRTFASESIDANVAFKLTHIGLDIDPELAYENAARIAQTAADCGNTMRLDMEQSRYVDATLAIYRRLRERFDNVGCVLQSYLFRSQDDLRGMTAPNVRLVKGAYLEPPDIAFERKREVDENYVRLACAALEGPGYTAIATHDAQIVAQIERFIRERDIPKRGRFEFQMLYGIGATLAVTLLERGYRVRLAVPFGDYWFPYLMRRLAERPANLAFFLKGAFTRG
jgi:proline dehydrogenase